MFSAIPQKLTSAKKDFKASAFKILISEVLSNNGDFSKINPNIKKASLKCVVKQAYPRFLISDGTFFIQAYFTKDCFNKCHPNKENEINISDLESGVISITKWEVQLVSTNSAEEFTSYNGIEMRMIIHDFKVQLNNEVKMNKYPANLYRDDEVKTLLNAFIQS